MVDGYQFRRGDIVKWVGPPKVVSGEVAVTTNELREVVDVRPGVVMLRGRGGVGVFGWCNSLLVEKVENLIAA